MARVTVEDCVDKIPNRFDLVMMAAHRSRAVSAGAPLTVDRDNDRNPVVALREIAEETIDLEETRDSLIRGLQRHVEVDEPEEEDTLEMMTGAIMAGEDDDSGQAPPAHSAVAAPDKPDTSDAPEEAAAAPAESAETPEAAAEGGESPEDTAATPEAAGETGADGPEKSE